MIKKLKNKFKCIIYQNYFHTLQEF